MLEMFNTKVNRTLVPSKTALVKAQKGTITYLTPEEVGRIVDAAKEGRNGERNALLIDLLFQTELRVSEALQLSPRMIQAHEGYPVLNILGKGRKRRMVSCPESLAHRLKSYCFEEETGKDGRIFKIKRCQAWKIIQEAAKKAGIEKKVYCHLFRHSGAIERLRQTGNPRALQLHLGHSSSAITLRYLNTLQEEDALRIEREVVF
jgi:integrase/recombinase XerD